MGHPISYNAGRFHLPHFHKKNSSLAAAIPYSIEEAHRELRNALRVNLEQGLMLSAAIHLLAVSVYYGVEYAGTITEDEPIVRVRIMKYSDLGPPPSITNSMSAPVIGVAKFGKPSIGMPIPVPDAEINPEQTIATQTEMSAVVGPRIETGSETEGGAVQITDDVMIEDDDPEMGVFVPVEKSPQIVRSVQPDYPEIARRAGIEATVWVNILVDKKGIPKRAVVVKEDGAGVFNEAAIKAAMTYQFTPAVMNSGPVQVWVSIKFRFQLVSSTK